MNKQEYKIAKQQIIAKHKNLTQQVGETLSFMEKKKLLWDEIHRLDEQRYWASKENLQKSLATFFKCLFLLFILKMKSKHFANWWFTRKNRQQATFTNKMAGEKFWQMLGGRITRAIFLGVMALVFIFPFFWMISMSFRSFEEVQNGITGGFELLPGQWSLEAYKFLFTGGRNGTAPSIVNAIGVSLLVAVISTITQIFVSLVGGYGLSRINSRWKELIIIVLLATLMIPGEALMVGQFIVASHLNLENSTLALIIPFIGNAFTIFLFKNAFDSIPPSVESSAKIDGMNRWRFFIKIAIPYIKGIIITCCLIAFISSWNSILWPTMIIKQDSKWITMPMILWQIVTSSATTGDIWDVNGSLDPQNLKMAAAIVSTIPMFLVFIFSKKYLVRGIVSSKGIKG
ncbi:carbohydrate ABC transporter permease [Williamsoniiplasma lucivorax]|uniref:sn-glycerol-3-phosphate ABC transporter permease n=1 Tax=Williamsoniiplasma lucivorax TaxID=209274 RepID=A0A2S5RDZ2_9MOLU|nr:carbohydrate ABC transporter permease [Williamsoniiplasma lucivorax]PPE05524.1 sn-glycerol-3-phosphate ABC transporter permease [Williamsoniiplasma lucivorax]